MNTTATYRHLIQSTFIILLLFSFSLLSAHNMTYTPYNPANTGVTIQYTVSIHDGGKDDIICNDDVQFKLQQQSNNKPQSQERTFAEMQVAPNPVSTTTTVYYQIQGVNDINGNARIDLYGIQGNLISTQKINKFKSVQSFDLSRQPSGVYFIVVYHQGQNIGQQILIKK